MRQSSLIPRPHPLRVVCRGDEARDSLAELVCSTAAFNEHSLQLDDLCEECLAGF